MELKSLLYFVSFVQYKNASFNFVTYFVSTFQHSAPASAATSYKFQNVWGFLRILDPNNPKKWGHQTTETCGWMDAWCAARLAKCTSEFYWTLRSFFWNLLCVPLTFFLPTNIPLFWKIHWKSCMFWVEKSI